MKRLLALLLLIPSLLFFGCLGGKKEEVRGQSQKLLEEVGYRGLTFYERVGGHTIRRHVGKSPSWLVRRLKEEPRLKAASSFYDLQTAEEAVRGAIRENYEKLLNWLRDPRAPDKLVLLYKSKKALGIKVERLRGGSFKESVSYTARVILKKDKRYGFIVLTAYPS